MLKKVKMKVIMIAIYLLLEGLLAVRKKSVLLER